MSKKSRPDAKALIHGTTWRAVSLGSKVAFLLLIVPRTVPGEYGLFFSYSSLGLLLSRVISFGAIDHLPTWVRGDAGAMGRAVKDFTPITLAAIAATAAAAASESLLIAALALALSMASGLMLAGAVRSVSPAWFERWLNLHPVLLLVMALLLGPEIKARELLLCQSGAILLSQLMFARAAAVVQPFQRTSGLPVWSIRLTAMLKGGHSRMVSDVLVAGCIRGVAIGPLLFGSGAVGDSTALALALGEAVWTVGMILVHRNFSFYCASGPDLRHSLRSATVLLVGIAVAGSVGAWLLSSFVSASIVQRVELGPLVAAFTLFAAIAALSELRYFDVASGKSLLPWVLGQTGFLAIAACSPYVVGEYWGVWLLAGLGVIICLAVLGRRARVSAAIR